MEHKILILLHVLGASIWTGGHLFVAFRILPEALKQKNIDLLVQFRKRYEKIGMPALIVQLLTGLRLATLYLSEWSMWLNWDNFHTRHVWLKLIFLVATFILAINAYRLFKNPKAEHLPIIAWHIGFVTLFSVILLYLGVSIRVGGF